MKKRNEKTEEEREKVCSGGGKLHRTAKPNIESEVYNNSKKYD